MSAPALHAPVESTRLKPRETKAVDVGPKIQKPAAVRSKDLGATFVGMATIAALTFGFMIKGKEYIVPGEGLGYKLGLTGGIMMLLLLIYPMVKRTRFFGSGTMLKSIFQYHMLLGVVGPVLIFYHSNFSMGALNSNIALFTMILVAGSGVIGRYIYTNIHSGLSGARLDVSALLSQATKLMLGIETDVGGSSGTVPKALADFSLKATPKKPSVLASFMNIIAMPVTQRLSRSKIMREVHRTIGENAKLQNWSRAQVKLHTHAAKNHVDEFISAVSRAAQFAFWERMFALWHVLHVPLFFLLLVSGVIHVVAVHLY